MSIIFNKKRFLEASAIALLLCGAGHQSTWAQNQSSNEEAGSDNNDKQARKLFESGERHYAAGRYEDAASDFLQAYELSKHADLLFNVANAYERIADYDSAVVYLEAYLQTPEVTNKVSVLQRIQRLKANSKKRKLREAEIADSARLTSNSDGQPGITAQKKSKVLPYSLMGAGAVLIGGGIVAGLASRSAGSDAEEKCASNGLCPLSAQDDIDNEKTYGLIADVAIGVGVIAAGVGTYLLITGNNNNKEQQVSRDFHLNLVPNKNGFQVGVSSVF